MFTNFPPQDYIFPMPGLNTAELIQFQLIFKSTTVYSFYAYRYYTLITSINNYCISQMSSIADWWYQFYKMWMNDFPNTLSLWMELN